MKLIDIFKELAPNKLFVSVVLGILSGICYAFLIPLLLNSFAVEDSYLEVVKEQPYTLAGFEVSDVTFALLFVGLCLFIFLTRTLSQIILVRMTMDLTSTLRLKLYQCVLRAPLDKLESMGFSKINATMTYDVERVIEGAEVFPNLLVSGVTLLSMLGLLYYLNEHLFVLVIGSIAFGAFTYLLMAFAGNYYFNIARQKVDDLYDAIHGTIFGIKELKLKRTKRNNFFSNVLCKIEQDVCQASKNGATVQSVAVNYGNVLGYFILGGVAFVFVNHYSVSQLELIGIIMVLIYISEPVSVLLETIPSMKIANISIRKINEMTVRLSDENISDILIQLPQWNTLSLKEIKYTYLGKESGFSVGPFNLSFSKGEITFIVGGNGSGKSTLGKLITSHYLAEKGSMHLDDMHINSGNLASYRNQVTAIFSDYHLFDEILTGLVEESKVTIDHYLTKLQLNNVVKIEGGRFSSLALSDGQRKRLALLISFLDDTDIYVFDEWAADQDPIFKKFFYYEILKELKELNKVIVVISHDERYYNCADKVVVLEEGKVKQVVLVEGQVFEGVYS
ncbi:cyclic peptide export ABC transporter [Rheinheimera baltica]|uniref:Cyclic peptide export ABC transporter n=1 Tax=Rheinheimera baltica TaxID=67576 RepID=A0ABT9HUF3_9GAMM|nr:cyclic peptide export ABC transporter [Rheinheimera baltica]MDP5134750.1 cyclic peptide export ABC transporter [Rheinheimera baltica]